MPNSNQDELNNYLKDIEIKKCIKKFYCDTPIKITSINVLKQPIYMDKPEPNHKDKIKNVILKYNDRIPDDEKQLILLYYDTLSEIGDNNKYKTYNDIYEECKTLEKYKFKTLDDVDLLNISFFVYNQLTEFIQYRTHKENNIHNNSDNIIESNVIKNINNKDSNNKGILYLLQPKQYIDTNIYKIGCSKRANLDRLRSYGKGTKYLSFCEVDNVLESEKNLISHFKKKFKLATGREYFEGNIEIMKQEFNHCIGDLINTANKSNS